MDELWIYIYIYMDLQLYISYNFTMILLDKLWVAELMQVVVQKFASAVWKVVDFIVLYLEKKKKKTETKTKKNRLSRKNLKK